jgi:hypothetical protein
MNKLIIIFVLCLVSIQAEITGQSLPRETTVYYWFYIQLGKSVDKESNSGRIFIKKIGNEIESGSFDNFIESNKQGLKNGKVIIGPFSEKSWVLKSQLLYKYAGRVDEIPPKELNPADEDSLFTFYYIKPMSEDFQRDINFERIPARVTNGTQYEFMSLLSEGLGFEKLAIGPFHDYELAEKSKFVFRKNGEPDSENAIDSMKSQGLRYMSKKWKTLHLEIVKQPDDKGKNRAVYRFNTKFPRKYFASDAFQAITVRAIYSDSFLSSSIGFTLQGDNVVDNNPVASFESGTLYINVFRFNKRNDAKITGFLFESFIYNNSEIIELDPVTINVN